MQRKFLRYSLSALTGLAIVSFVSTAFPSSQLLAQTKQASLAQWYEQANQYYHAVQSGNAKKPPPAEWNQFVSQMQWARQQLGGTMATKKGPQQTGEQGYFVRMWNQPAGGIQTKTGASGVPSKSNAAAKYGGFYESFVIKGKNSNPTSSAPKKQPVENLNTVIQGSRIRF